jgi:hypothetical protein
MASPRRISNPFKHTLHFDIVRSVNLVRGVYAMNRLSRPNSFLKLSWRNRIAVAMVVWISCTLVGALPAAAKNIPTGTIELSGGSVAAGIGYTWAEGTLVFEGKKYPLKVEGISILQVGVSDYTASGTVYNLQKLSDINGVYTAVSAGAAVAGGPSVTAMKNSHGVLIQMVAMHEGLNLSLGAKGVTIALKENQQ